MFLGLVEINHDLKRPQKLVAVIMQYNANSGYPICTKSRGLNAGTLKALPTLFWQTKTKASSN